MIEITSCATNRMDRARRGRRALGRARELFGKRRVEGARAGGKIERAHELHRLACTVLAIHHRVFPLDRERTRVTAMVQRAHDALEVDAAVSWRSEIPEASFAAEVAVSAEHARFR